MGFRAANLKRKLVKIQAAALSRSTCVHHMFSVCMLGIIVETETLMLFICSDAEEEEEKRRKKGEGRRKKEKGGGEEKGGGAPAAVHASLAAVPCPRRPAPDSAHR